MQVIWSRGIESWPGDPAAVGPYRIVSRLGSWRGSPRYLALNEHTQSNHILYALNLPSSRDEEAIGVASVRSGHLSPVEDLRRCVEAPETLWAVTPYLGNPGGLLTLPELAELRIAQGFTTPEAIRGLTQLLSAAADLRPSWRMDEFDADEVLVDRHGRLWVEMPGWGALVNDQSPAVTEHAGTEDVCRSVFAIGYWMLTGRDADEPRLPVGRLAKKLSRQHAAWIDRGLDEISGFATAAEALDACPDTLAPAVVVNEEAIASHSRLNRAKQATSKLAGFRWRRATR